MQIKRTRTIGHTAWEATERRWVGKGRGMALQDVRVRDRSGKPCERAVREVILVIECSDMVTYSIVFAGRRTEPRGARLLVHGMNLYVHWFDLPHEIQGAYRQWARQVAVCMFVARKHINALPEYRPLST